MKDCLQVEEAVWTSARTGEPLPEAVREHLNQCSSCTALMEQARVISQGLMCAGRVPDSPDCRGAVAALISPRRTRLRPAWALGLAVTVAVVAVVFALMRPSVEPRLQNVVRAPQTQPQPKHAESPQMIQRPAPVERVIVEQPGELAKLVVRPVRHHERRYVPIRRMTAHVPREQRRPIRYEEPAASEVNDEPYLEITVSSPEKTSETSGYSYVSRNEETGEVTRCSVVGAGDSVTVYMEEEPAPI